MSPPATSGPTSRQPIRNGRALTQRSSSAHEFQPGIPLKIGGGLIPHHAGLAGHSDGDVLRSEERRVGKEGRSRWSAYHLKKKEISWRDDADSRLNLVRGPLAAPTDNPG